jgi:pyruvate,water dikinase
MSLAELRAALAGFVEIRCHKWLDASLADAASMICYGALERLRRGPFPGGAVHTSLLKAIPDVVSGEPVLELWDLSRLVRENDALRDVMEAASPADTLALVRSDLRFVQFREAFQSYLDRWGFRCSEELMLTSPSFQENPAPLVEMIRAYARIDSESPRDAVRVQTAERQRETRRVVSELSLDRAVLLRALLPRTHSAIRYRERARLKQALLYSRCRRVALALGDALVTRGIIAERDGVFFLTWQELDELAGGGAMLPHAVHDVIAARQREHARLSATNPPDSFALAEGEYLDEACVPEDDFPPAPGERLAGIPACGGQGTGRAAVLRDVTESARLERGDILVTKQTDPGWAPAFFLISGLVIERGGMLSHGAIIAREFGIPCVVGVKNAMARIPSGATIAVDGDTGNVHVDV